MKLWPVSIRRVTLLQSHTPSDVTETTYVQFFWLVFVLQPSLPVFTMTTGGFNTRFCVSLTSRENPFCFCFSPNRNTVSHDWQLLPGVYILSASVRKQTLFCCINTVYSIHQLIKGGNSCHTLKLFSCFEGVIHV